MRPIITEEDLAAMRERVSGARSTVPDRSVTVDAGRVDSGARHRNASTTHSPSSPYRSSLERQYADYLHTLMRVGEIQFYQFEPVRLIIGKDCTWQPDFLVMLNDGTLEWHEVKGRRREDAMIKIRVAVKQFHWWKFVLVEHKRGVWEQKEL
jgi:hypothetical protein